MLNAPWLHAAEAQVLQRLAAAASVFCFLDYDGTLAPIAPTPNAAAPLPGSAELLRELAAIPDTRLALVTGRSVADLRRFLDIPGAYYVGLHGAEVLEPGGELHLAREAEASRAALPALKEQLQRALAGLPGIVLEDKGAALACHYRLATPAAAAKARQIVEACAHDHQQRGVPITVASGHEVIEVRPAGTDKGKTVCALLAAHAPVDLVIYVGDDRTDEDAFALLPADAITIRVGPAAEPTRARYRLNGPADVQRFLRAAIAARQRR